MRVDRHAVRKVAKSKKFIPYTDIKPGCKCPSMSVLYQYLKAYHEIEIAVRNPNTPFTNVVSRNLDAGERWEIPMDLQGMIGTNTATLELSRIPPIDFGKCIT